jgi:hypothetical protein
MKGMFHTLGTYEVHTCVHTYKGLVRKSQRMKLYVKSVHELEDNAKINFKERRCESHDWFQLTQGRIQCQAVLNL